MIEILISWFVFKLGTGMKIYGDLSADVKVVSFAFLVVWSCVV